jgi:tRNA U38,U39,U40 pseudouridine synthase TruA
VRALVGAVVAVGLGRFGPEEVRAALEPGSARPRAGYAPPQGLFLWAVEY